MTTEAVTVFTGNYNDMLAAVPENKLIVIDFFATWCGPCRRLGQQLPKLVQDFPNVQFYKVDIDANAALTDYYSVRSVPHIKFFRKETDKLNELYSITGFDLNKLKSKLEQYKN
ncbi:Thioredoxin family protein [Trichomonas vaginalis G3]|uniref:Thioredoxin family protein n=1 Tax=Trichomonas vaginalis (strain ATCC PRA-98 / G3) TaxID=412133 RepID=A2G1V3_TRIV3|nr:cell redox homeostasis [Trichomonas vaginalis G3]EAX88861.1 Thioredoxin family protein [Trichomonas vaginalis G3]KAI5521846.1 cell redox homeostasis [Trichomonas vaginalis G3]|eukprot:XP_001301791.1 Thioredoxin family protein [Trichomonas vaginalis G3]